MGCRVASDALEARQLHFECAEWIAGTDTSGTSKREESTLRATSASVIRMAEVLRSEGMIKRAMPQASQTLLQPLELSSSADYLRLSLAS